MNLKIVLPLLALSLTSQLSHAAPASARLLHCELEDARIFSLELTRVPSERENEIQSGFANSPHEKNVAIKSQPVEIRTQPILNQNLKAMSIFVTLPDDTRIDLNDISSAPIRGGQLIGIRGLAQS